MTGRTHFAPPKREIAQPQGCAIVGAVPEPSFGIVVREVRSTASFAELVRRADALGCDVIAAPDHLGAPDPFAVLSAAAGVSERLRLRTYVLNQGFWNPALLARAAATVDALSGGRLELGLGAGHMRHEHEDAGLPWSPHGARVRKLESTLVEVRRRLAQPEHQPRPAQHPIPIAVGAMTGPGLRIAAEHADIVAFAGLLQVRAAPAGTFTIATAAQTDAAVAEVRRHAGGRRYRSDALLQAVVIGEPPAQAARRLAESFQTLSAELLLDTPFVLLAHDRAHAAEILAQRRERFGFDGFSAHQPALEALGELIAAARR
jgi:probable F420-dependent oxidoreductase